MLRSLFQLQLPFRFEQVPSEQAKPVREISLLEKELSQRLQASVSVSWTKNRSSLFTSRWLGGQWIIRAHEMFKDAPPNIVTALARYIQRRDKAAGKTLDAFIASHQHLIAKPKRQRKIFTKGTIYDLDDLFAEINQQYFGGTLTGVTLTWGRTSRRRRRRSLHLGTYFPDEKLIRIHPVLDQTWVPEPYIRFVLYHEMLHHALPAIRGEKRIRYHTAEFRRQEKRFESYAEVVAWEEQHFSKLLRAANRSPA